MKVDKKDLEKVAHLARIQIKPEEEEQLTKDMGEIMTWVEKLKEVDTIGVEPLTHMTEEINVLREDEAQQTITRENGLKNAPDHNDKFFKVPKVLKRND